MCELIENYETNDMVDAIRAGKLTIPDAIDEAIQAWLSALQQTGERMRLPYVEGTFTTEDYQSAFAAVSEHTTSSPSGLHYTLWKSLAKEDDIARWLAIMLSLPFLFGFVN